MGKSRSAKAGGKVSAKVWEIVRNQGGSFDMFHNGKLLHESIPDRWLESQLARYGFCGQEYKDIRSQLEQHGKVRIDFDRPSTSANLSHLNFGEECE